MVNITRRFMTIHAMVKVAQLTPAITYESVSCTSGVNINMWYYTIKINPSLSSSMMCTLRDSYTLIAIIPIVINELLKRKWNDNQRCLFPP